ncbi:hypothetical protein STEG23_011194 [Scotinomys teguina]
MPFNRRMDKENVVHIHNGVLCSRENNDIMKFAGKWMELENVVLSEAARGKPGKLPLFSSRCARAFPRMESQKGKDGYSRQIRKTALEHRAEQKNKTLMDPEGISPLRHQSCQENRTFPFITLDEAWAGAAPICELPARPSCWWSSTATENVPFTIKVHNTFYLKCLNKDTVSLHIYKRGCHVDAYRDVHSSILLSLMKILELCKGSSVNTDIYIIFHKGSKITVMEQQQKQLYGWSHHNTRNSFMGGVTTTQGTALWVESPQHEEQLYGWSHHNTRNSFMGGVTTTRGTALWVESPQHEEQLYGWSHHNTRNSFMGGVTTTRGTALWVESPQHEEQLYGWSHHNTRNSFMGGVTTTRGTALWVESPQHEEQLYGWGHHNTRNCTKGSQR